MDNSKQPVLTVVACVGQKLTKPAPAADLYVSDWFVKARRYVEATGRPWIIYSAKLFAVDPAEVIEPYDLTMRDLDRDYRKQRGENVALAIRRKLEDLGCFGEGQGRPVVEVLAGWLYREYLVPALERRGIDVVVPMEGLGIGKQKQWLRLAADAQTAARAAQAAQLDLQEGDEVALGDRGYLVRVKADTYVGTGRNFGPILELLDASSQPVGASYYAGTLTDNPPVQLRAAPWLTLTCEETEQLVELARQAIAKTWKPADCYDASPEAVDRRWREFLERCRASDARLETPVVAIERAPLPTLETVESARAAVAAYQQMAATDESGQFDQDGEESNLVFGLMREAGWDAQQDADFCDWCLKATPLECVLRASHLFEQSLEVAR